MKAADRWLVLMFVDLAVSPTFSHLAQAAVLLSLLSHFRAADRLIHRSRTNNSANKRDLDKCRLQHGCETELVATSIKLPVSSTWQKITFSSDYLRKMAFCCLWHTSRTRAHNKLSEAEQLFKLFLFQYIVLLALHQSSCLNSHCKLKSTKVPVDLCLDKARFLVIAHRKQPTLFI